MNKKLVIVSSFKCNGILNDDTEHLSLYTELGWELYTSGLKAKEMAIKGEINNQDYIMTHPERMFIYKDIGCNVIEYNEEYIKSFNGEVIDLTKNLMSILSYYNHRKLTENELMALSYNNSKPSFIPDKPFVCFVLRLRDHVSFRGGPINFWQNEMNSVLSKNLDVYCVGKGANNFVPNGVKCVNLEDYVSLIKNPLCQYSIGPSSGCMLLNYCFGKSPTKILFFQDDINFVDQGDGVGHLLFFGKQGNL